MDLGGQTVQVTRPTAEHNLAEGVVGTARRLGGNFPEHYSLVPEDPKDRQKLQGILFHESELERLV